MDMQRIIKVLRIALPVVFFGFLGVIAFNWNRARGGGERSDAEPVTSTQRPLDQGIAESKTFEDTQTIGGRVVSRIRAERVVAFVSGWNTLEEVHLTIYRPTGLTYELICPQAQFNSETKEAEAKGGVKVTSSDGVEIATAEIRFDGTRLMNEIPVQFRIDRWTGHAGALDLDVPAETLRLHSNLEASMAPSLPAELPMMLKSAEGTFRRKENDVTFVKDVLLTRGVDTLRSDRIMGRFTNDRKTLTGLEGTGHVLIALGAASTAIGAPSANTGGRKEITCNRFVGEPGMDGSINTINAFGDEGMAQAVLEGPPRRELAAKLFRVALADKRVKEIKAEDNATMKELGPTSRQVSANRMTFSFDAGRQRPVSAFLEGNVKYVDPRNSAAASRANYDIMNDRVLLTADPGFDPTVVSDGQTLKAKQIEFSPKAGTAKATGEVIAQLTSKGNGPAADSTNIFPSSKPVFVNADLLIMRQSNKTAIFTGHVRAWQEENTMFANELQVQGAGQTVSARGAVRALLQNITGENRKTPLQARCGQLNARKNERRIELIGNVHIEDEARTLESEKATFYLDAQRKVERIEAENKVVVLERTTGRKGTGDKAVYLVAKKMIYVNGSPATATAPNGSFSGQQIAFDLNRNKVQVLSPTGQTEGTYKP